VWNELILSVKEVAVIQRVSNAKKMLILARLEDVAGSSMDYEV
jgi:hypothetical protein